MHDNRFQIAGGAPGQKISWQVTGIRQDAYANAHRIVVEENKPAEEVGHYLHPGRARHARVVEHDGVEGIQLEAVIVAGTFVDCRDR